jgi:hypothetical protein
MKTIQTLILVVAISFTAFAQDCDEIRNSINYFSAAATGVTEEEARINALTLLAENISSVVSSRTDMLTKDDGAPTRQKFSNYSKSTSLLQLKGVRYITCDRNKKSGITTLAFISRKDLEQSALEVSARVQQYLTIMEQKEAAGTDFLPEAYIAYLNTFVSPYAIEYNSTTRHITNVRGYLESYLRSFLSNITLSCPAVTENPEYPGQQLTMALSLAGANNTRMRFLIDIPEYAAKGFLDGANGNMDIIMTPDARTTKFTATLLLVPPPVEPDLKEISDQIEFSREVTLEANMSSVIKLDVSVSRENNELVLTPTVKHLTIRRLEWMSEGTFLSTGPQLRIAEGALKEITLRVNNSDNLTVTKTLPSFAGSDPASGSTPGGSGIIRLESIGSSPADQMPLAQHPSFSHDVIVLVYCDKRDLIFHSSMSAIDWQTYNSLAARYELIVKPVKQILSVEGDGLIEKNREIISPESGQILYFKATVMSAYKGLLTINSKPSNVEIFINDIETAYRTPCKLALHPGLIKISLQRHYFEPKDTVIRVEPGGSKEITMALKRAHAR